jgi:hypothetical protein
MIIGFVTVPSIEVFLATKLISPLAKMRVNLFEK